VTSLKRKNALILWLERITKMKAVAIPKRKSKDKIGKVKDLSSHPFFVKKAKQTIAFLKKHGTPSTAKKS